MQYREDTLKNNSWGILEVITGDVSEGIAVAILKKTFVRITAGSPEGVFF